MKELLDKQTITTPIDCPISGDSLVVVVDILSSDLSNSLKEVSVSLEKSSDGVVWFPDCGFTVKGGASLKEIDPNPKPSCILNISSLRGKKLRLIIVPLNSITMTSNIISK